MSNWEYDQYTGAEWNENLEFYTPGSRNGLEAAELSLEPDGTVGVMVTGGCYSCSGENRRQADLTLDQAIELVTYLQSIVIPNLMEKELV